jgi:hypothetical protein
MSLQGSLFLLRGPVLILGVVASVLWPYVSTWSFQCILQLVTASVGVLWLISDLLNVTKTNIRNTISKALDNFVLDDFLKTLHDPETGIIPCAIGSCLGASSMYGLRLDDQQKTKLVQASLWTTNEEARSILLDAGGTKALLPPSLQEWLDDGRSKKETIETRPPAVTVETVEETASDSSVSECQHNFEESPKMTKFEGRDNIMSRGNSPREIGKISRKGIINRPNEVSFEEEEESQLRIPQGIPTDPIALMFSILRDMAIEKVRPLFASIPDTKVEIVGTVAAMGLCAQILLRWRSNRSALGSISALCLSGATLGAFSTVLLRHAMLGSIHDMDSLKMISAATVSRSFERIKRVLSKHKQWRGAVALIILGLIGRKRVTTRAPASKVLVPR